MAGYVYLMGNRAMPTFYKVGMSTLHPFERAAQLSRATGVPEAFDVICFFRTEKQRDDEAHLHEFLTDFRNSFAREFFRFGIDHMPWVAGLFMHHPHGQSFWMCDGWRLHKYLDDSAVENPWAERDAEGNPQMTRIAPDRVYVREELA